jgi:hypothetical protein
LRKEDISKELERFIFLEVNWRQKSKALWLREDKNTHTQKKKSSGGKFTPKKWLGGFFSYQWVYNFWLNRNKGAYSEIRVCILKNLVGDQN